MYITFDHTFGISARPDNAVVQILPPVCIENGVEHTVLPVRENGCSASYADARNAVTLTIEQRSDTLFYLRRSWKNLTEQPRRIQTVLRAVPLFGADKFLIPCVSHNGNEFGAGLEPKGLTRDGKKWIFGYDRVSIPACTLTENADFSCSLFASAEDAASLESSCAIGREPSGFVQELLHPVIEAPVSYSSRDKYSDGFASFIDLAPGETFTTGCYLCVSKPRWPGYGICDTLDAALGIFANSPIETPADGDLWDRSITFAKSLITELDGMKGFIIGFLPDGNGGFAYRTDRCFELAWCGQNVLFCRMLIEDFVRRSHDDSLALALEILDTRVAVCTAKSGLVASQLRDYANLDAAAADTCNMGYGVFELLRVWEKLQSLGIDRPAYLETARNFCEFFLSHFSDEHGFGKLWRLDGTLLDPGGSIGGFVILPLVKYFELTGDARCLDLAGRAMRFYMARDLDRFVCTAGALDTCCVDKETAAPFLMSGVMLYEATKDPAYLTMAEKAAYYFTAWMFHYNPIYADDSEFSVYNVKIHGLTSVSAQHHHLDMYAGIVVPWLEKLAKYTGDARWSERADMMWRAVTQYIGDGERKIHGVVRPVGSQNEALFHCHWSFGHTGVGRRGLLNDWLVAWPCAFRLSVLAEKEF